MIELPDDELDKLFRKSSEELDPHFDPEDWNALRKRLDAQDGITPAAWFRKWWPIGMLLLLIPAGILTYNGFQETEKRHVASGQTAAETAERSATLEASARETKPGANKRETIHPDVDAGDEIQVKTEVKKADKKELPERDFSENRGIRVDTNSDSSELTGTEIIERKDFRTNHQKIGKIRPRSQSKTGGVYLEPNRSKGKGGDGAFSSVSKIEAGNVNTIADRIAGVDAADADRIRITYVKNSVPRPLKWNYAGMPLLVKGISAKVIPVASVPSSKVSTVPKWAIRLGYSPDLTTVGLKNFNKPGSAISLLAEYGLSQKLYAQAGIVRSVKDYYTNASEYQLSKYVTKVNTPYSVDGACTMIEIPLGLRYDITQRVNSKWFVGSGITSYYVQKEKYVYHYKKYVHNQVMGWSGKSGLSLFSHVTASAGYERTITSKLTILAEPYIRIPLKGVGYGKVNLVTTGMWLSLRYAPVFK